MNGRISPPCTGGFPVEGGETERGGYRTAWGAAVACILWFEGILRLHFVSLRMTAVVEGRGGSRCFGFPLFRPGIPGRRTALYDNPLGPSRQLHCRDRLFAKGEWYVPRPGWGGCPSPPACWVNPPAPPSPRGRVTEPASTPVRRQGCSGLGFPGAGAKEGEWRGRIPAGRDGFFASSSSAGPDPSGFPRRKK